MVASMIPSANMDSRFLLPDLPPELRNLIYSYTVTQDNPATNVGLPFQSKVYDSSHTKVTMIPVHHGNPNLLALQKYCFQEASEYHSWLLANAIEIRIGVLFKGNVNTFVQEHWDKKMAAHLKNLVKKHPWLDKVSKYHIQILWEPVAWVHSKRRKSVGGIAARMVEVLSQAMDSDLRRKNAFIKTGLHLGQFVACDYATQHQALGLAEFILVEKGRTRKQVREVRFTPDGLNIKQHINCLPSHLKAPPKSNEAKNVLVDEGGIVQWGDSTKGLSLVRTEIEGVEERVLMHPTNDLDFESACASVPPAHVHLAVIAECLDARDR